MHTNLRNKNFITRYTCFMLVIGFFYGCSSLNPTLNSTIKEQPLEDILSIIDKQLKLNPNKQDLHIKKGDILIELAYTENIENRTPFYEQAIISYSKANSLGLTNLELQAVEISLNNAWLSELNSGIEIFKNHSSDQDLSLAEHNFDNAILLNKKDPNGYIYKSKVWYKKNDINKAIQILDDSSTEMTTIPTEFFEHLGFLYTQKNNISEARRYYELAIENNNPSKNVYFGLANLYISNQDHESAISLLNKLETKYPDDAQIKNALGTQLFIIAEGLFNDMSKAYSESNSVLGKDLLIKAEKTLQASESQLMKAFEKEPFNDFFVKCLATFYNNSTGIYLASSEVVSEQEKKFFIDKTEVNLGSAIEFYELYKSIEPAHTDISSTIEVLTQLKKVNFTDIK